MFDKHTRNALVFLAIPGAWCFVQSMISQDMLFSIAGFGLMLVGAIGSVLPVQPKWGHFETFWFVVPLKEKNLPIHVYGHGIAAVLVFGLMVAYAFHVQAQIPGLIWLTPWYFWMCIGLLLLTIAMLMLYARSYPEWRSILRYSKRRELEEGKSVL